MRAKLTLAVFLACLTALVCGARADDRWTLYANDRFGAHLAYPAAIFVMQPPPENDDGRTLVAADGAKILVFGAYNVMDETLAAKRASLVGPDYARVVYRASGANWFVVSGYRDIGGVESIFYEKYILSAASDTIHSLIVTYPSALKSRYDPIAARVAASFGGP